MKSLTNGKNISASVENITPFGIWLFVKGLFVKGKEYFLNNEEYPYFKEQTVQSVQNVQLLHEFHLFWPDLDVDLEIDNLENQDKYPLKFKVDTKAIKIAEKKKSSYR